MPTPVQGVRPIGNTVWVRASTSAGAAATPTAGGGQQIKVVGATGQPGGITGIAQQGIKVVQGAQPGIKVAQANLRQTAVIGGQIRLASPGKLAIELSFKKKKG